MGMGSSYIVTQLLPFKEEAMGAEMFEFSEFGSKH